MIIWDVSFSRIYNFWFLNFSWKDKALINISTVESCTEISLFTGTSERPNSVCAVTIDVTGWILSICALIDVLTVIWVRTCEAVKAATVKTAGSVITEISLVAGIRIETLINVDTS